MQTVKQHGVLQSFPQLWQLERIMTLNLATRRAVEWNQYIDLCVRRSHRCCTSLLVYAHNGINLALVKMLCCFLHFSRMLPSESLKYDLLASLLGAKLQLDIHEYLICVACTKFIIEHYARINKKNSNKFW